MSNKRIFMTLRVSFSVRSLMVQPIHLGAFTNTIFWSRKVVDVGWSFFGRLDGERKLSILEQCCRLRSCGCRKKKVINSKEIFKKIKNVLTNSLMLFVKKLMYLSLKLSQAYLNSRCLAPSSLPFFLGSSTRGLNAALAYCSHFYRQCRGTPSGRFFWDLIPWIASIFYLK